MKRSKRPCGRSCPAQLLPEYVEVESGKHNHRPQLLVVIAEAWRAGATL